MFLHQATLKEGRIYSVLIQPSSDTGRRATTMHSFNITRDWDLDKEIIPFVEERIAILQAKYNEEFLGYTDIKFKDIGPYVPALETKKTLPTADSPITVGPRPAASAAETPHPSWRPVPVRGTGAMDPIAQDIISGLKPSLDKIQNSLVTPTKGWERLAETFANVIERAASPIPGAFIPPQQTDLTPLLERLDANHALTQQLIETLASKQAPVMGETSIHSSPDVVALEARHQEAINLLSAKMDSQQESLQAQITQQNNRFDLMMAQIADLRSDLLQQRTDMEARFVESDKRFAQLIEVIAPKPSNSDDSSGSSNGSPAPAPSSSPAPAPDGAPNSDLIGGPYVPFPLGVLPSPPMGTLTLPTVMPAIHPKPAYTAGLPVAQIISADLETLQGHGGPQTPFLCAWYGTPHNLGEKYMVFDSLKRTPEAMLQEFWKSLLIHCQGCTVYFHNWAGYDSILSLAALLSLKGYKFVPIIRDGKVISLTVQDVKTKVTCLTIKDSIKLIPGALGKLAKDFGCETQKDHFPHYFNPIDHGGSIH